MLAAAARYLLMDVGHWISRDTLVLLASHDCAFSRDLFSQINLSADLGSQIQLVPIDRGGGRSPAVFEMCDAALAQLSSQDVWQVRFLPRSTACHALVEYGNEMHRAHFRYYPAWMLDQRPIEDDALEASLGERGIEHDQSNNTLWLPSKGYPEQRRNAKIVAPPADPDDPLAFAVGHTIGW